MSEKQAPKRTLKSRVHTIRVIMGIAFLIFALVFGGYEFYLANNSGSGVPAAAWIPLTTLVLGMGATGAAFLGIEVKTLSGHEGED